MQLSKLPLFSLSVFMMVTLLFVLFTAVAVPESFLLTTVSVSAYVAPASGALNAPQNAHLRQSLQAYKEKPNVQTLHGLSVAALSHKEMMQNLLDTNPRAFLFAALSEDDVAQFPPAAQSALERHVEGEGSLLVLHADNFETGESSFIYFLSDGAIPPHYAQYPELVFAEGNPRFLSGSRVSFRGVQLGNEIAIFTKNHGDFSVTHLAQPIPPPPVDDTSSMPDQTLTGNVSDALAAKGGGKGGGGSPPPPPPPSGGSGGTPKVAIILVDYATTSLSYPFLSTTEIKGIMANNTRSVSKYFLESSYQKINISGYTDVVDVYGPYKTFDAKPICFIPYISADADNAMAFATNDGFKANDYNNVIILHPEIPSCYSGAGWVGSAEQLPGQLYAESFINGNKSFYLTTIAHELSHNFGVFHAGSVNCPDADGDWFTYQYSTICTYSEYGDAFDVMGAQDADLSLQTNENTFQMSAYHKGRVGWLSPGNILEVTPSNINSTGDYVLGAVEGNSGTVSLRIPMPKVPSEYYYLEYRNGSGFDASINGNPSAQGLFIRIAEDYLLQYHMTSDGFLTAVDAYSGDDTLLPVPPFNTSGLAKDKTFEDIDNCIKITNKGLQTSGKGKNAASQEMVHIDLGCKPKVSAGTPHNLVVNQSHTHSGATTTDSDNDLASYQWSWKSCPEDPSGKNCPALSGISGGLSGGATTINVPGPSYIPASGTGAYTLVVTVKDQQNHAASSTITENATLSSPIFRIGVSSGPVPELVAQNQPHTHCCGSIQEAPPNVTIHYEYAVRSCLYLDSSCTAAFQVIGSGDIPTSASGIVFGNPVLIPAYTYTPTCLGPNDPNTGQCAAYQFQITAWVVGYPHGFGTGNFGLNYSSIDIVQ